MARFALSAFLLMAAAAVAADAFSPEPQGTLKFSTTIPLQASSADDDQGRDDVDLVLPARTQGITARQARIMAPMSAALATVPLGSTAAVAGEMVDGSFQTSVKEYFPGAMPNSQVSSKVMAALKKRDYGKDNTLFGASICSDEINSTPNSLCAMLQKGLTSNSGGMFNLGGLGGLPFVGKSGFGAFFSHCPVDGKVVILFGPHVGVSQAGVVGKVERVGMSSPSTACGAGIGAYKALLSEKNNKGPPGAPANWDMDRQEEWIVQELKGKLRDDEYGNSIGPGFMGNAKMATVTYRTYDLVWDLLKKGLDISVTKPEFWEKVTEVTLLGGIVINQGHYKSTQKAMMEDYFQPFCFQSWRVDDIDEAIVKEDLFRSTFQMKNPKKVLGL